MKRDRAEGADAAEDGAAPFDLSLNQLTAETLAKGKRGEDLHSAKDAENLFDRRGV